MYVFTDENQIDSYGDRVLVSGLDIKRFQKNPILLYRHGRYELPIGRVLGLEKKEGKLVASTIDWDIEDDFAKTIKEKYEKGFMSGFSIGFDGKAYDETQNIEGQQGFTWTKSELWEISCVVMPANPEAVQIRKELQKVLQAKEQKKNSNDKNEGQSMKLVLKQLNLADSASEAEAALKITEMQKQLEQKEGQLKDLEKKVADQAQTLTKDRAKMLIEKAVGENKITKAQEPHFLVMAEQNYEATKAVIDSMDAYVSITAQQRQAQGKAQGGAKNIIAKYQQRTSEGWVFKDWQQKDSEGLVELRQNHEAEYKELLETVN